MNKTSMEYWLPRLEASGVPTPKTVKIAMPNDLRDAILAVLWGEKTAIDWQNSHFFTELRDAMTTVGCPCFLRTDLTSAKHSWERSCYIASAEDAVGHVVAIAEFSQCADLFGLPFDVWYVRELLPSVKFGSCPRYGNMPVAREFRFFVGNGKIKCFHPYWPLTALQQGQWGGGEAEYKQLCEPLDDEPRLRELAETVSRAIEGAWSVDVLQTETGWYVTDMAEAEKSFHWEECQSLKDR